MKAVVVPGRVRRSGAAVLSFSTLFFLLLSLEGTAYRVRRRGSSAGATFRQPKQVVLKSCSCDCCTSEKRQEGAAVDPAFTTDWHCIPPVAGRPTACPNVDGANDNCLPDDDLASGAEGLPYVHFCLTHCKPLVNDLDQQCIPLIPMEKAVAKTPDGLAKDGKIPTWEESLEYDDYEGALKTMAEGGKPVKKLPEPPNLDEVVDAAKKALGEVKAAAQHVTLAKENAAKALAVR